MAEAGGKGVLRAVPTITKQCQECGAWLIKCDDGKLLDEKPVAAWLKDGQPVRDGRNGQQAMVWVERAAVCQLEGCPLKGGE